MISKLAKEDTLKGDWLSSVSTTVLKMQMVISTNEENKYMQELTQRVRNLADIRVYPLDWIEPPTLGPGFLARDNAELSLPYTYLAAAMYLLWH